MQPALAVVFDCDGVLVDSEPASVVAWEAALAELGHRAATGVIEAFVGHTDSAIADHFGAELGIDPVTVDEAARRQFERIIRSGLDAYPDALEMLDWLEARRLPIAVASNSSRRRLDAVLAASGLSGRIPVTVAGDEVPRPKPAPDVYLVAARRLGVDPRRCVCFEDSPAGIEAARNAELRVVAVDRGTFDRTRLAAADLVVEQVAPVGFGDAPSIRLEPDRPVT